MQALEIENQQRLAMANIDLGSGSAVSKGKNFTLNKDYIRPPRNFYDMTKIKQQGRFSLKNSEKGIVLTLYEQIYNWAVTSKVDNNTVIH